MKQKSEDRRALVVEDNPAHRQEICAVLARKGYEVSACDSLGEGRKFFRCQPLVVAGCEHGNGKVLDFVRALRDEAGAEQPYIITLVSGDEAGQGPAAGVNDVLPTPLDNESLQLKLDAAGDWLAGRSDGIPEVTGNTGPREPLFDPGTLDIARELVGSTAGDSGATDDAKAPPEAGDDSPPSEAAGAVSSPPEPVRLRRGSGRAAQREGSGAATRYHLQLMVESCPLAMAMFDRGMNYLIANTAWRRAFGLSETRLTGRGHFEIFSEVSEKWQLLCERCMSEGEEQLGEELVEWADGARDWVRWTMRPWLFDDGVVGGIVVSSQSITGEKRLRREQRFEADVAETVMASSTSPVLVLDVNGRIVRSNAVAKRLGRWDPAGDDDHNYWDAFLRKGKRRASQEQFMAFARKLHEDGDFEFPESGVEEVVGHDGKPRRIVWSNSPRRDEEGKVNGIVRVGFDLDRFEDPEREEARRLELLDSLPVPAWRCDGSGQIDHFNAAWLALRGRDQQDELDNAWMDAVSEADIDPIIDALRAAAADRKSFARVLRLAAADGQTRWMRFSASPGAGDGESFYGVAIDVTAEHELDAAAGETQRLREDSEEASGRAARFEAELAALAVEHKRLKSERSATAEELERYRVIPDCAPFGIVLLGRDGKTIYSNPALVRVAGSDPAREKSLEDWLFTHCHESGDEAASDLVENWRATVWRKGATGVFPVSTDDGGTRELEFRPKLMDDGGLLVTVFDVTDTRRGEEALRASEAKFRALFRDAGVGMALTDRQGELFDTNPALEAMLGYSGAELRGRRIEDLLAGDGPDALIELLKDMAEAGRRTGEMATELATADGAPISAQMHLSQVKGSEGRLLFTTYFFHDISDMVMVERGLEESRAENRALLGASPDMILVLDEDGRVVDLIPPVGFPLEVDREASLGRALSEVLPGLDIGFGDIRDGADGGPVFSHRFRVERETGPLHLELRASRGGPGGGDAGARGRNTTVLVRDVTLVQEAQVKLKWQALTFAHINDAIVVADMRGRVIDWNPAAERLFGYTREEAIGLGLHELYGADDPHAFRDSFTGAIREHRRWQDRCEVALADGGRRACEAVFVPLQDEDGTPLALVGVNRGAEAGGADQLAGESASRSVREDMQNRINATLKTISTLLGLKSPDGSFASARASRERVDALAMLQAHIGEEADRAGVDFGAYAKELVGELLDSEAPEDADVEVHLNVKDVRLPATLAMPVALVANELLANAFRHGCAGRERVVVAFGLELDTAARRGTIAVRDDGAGLPSAFSLDGGSGLGLRIVRGLAERIGGTIELGSGPETEFRVGFRLPPRE